MSKAIQAFGDNSGSLFSSVRQLSELTSVLAANDAFVQQFIGDLAGVSAQLAGERDDLRAALASLARVVTVVRGFVHDNKDALTTNVKNLTGALGAIAKEKEALATAIQLAPLGLGNLTLAYDVKTGSIGSRVQFGPTAQSLGNVLCDVVVNSGVSNPQMACEVLKALTKPLANSGTDIGAGIQVPGFNVSAGKPADGLSGLLGGAR